MQNKELSMSFLSSSVSRLFHLFQMSVVNVDKEWTPNFLELFQPL